MSRRTDRVGEQITHIASEILREEISEELGMVTVTRSFATPDLKEAKVYISCLVKSNESKVLKEIEMNGPEIQRKLGSRIKMKFTPKLRFEIDHGLDEVEKIEKIIEKIEEK